MTRLWKRKMMPALLAGTMVFSFGGTVPLASDAEDTQNEFAVVTFIDVDEHWAKDVIEYMAENDIINGFEDFTFRPDEPVTQLQAVTIVMNLLAQKVNLETNGDAYIGEVPDWAQESVELALYNDIVTWEEIENYNQEATRMFIVELLVNALGVETGNLNEDSLTFYDINDLSSQEKSYLSLALENEFVQGYEDNSFRPEQSVTRAEMAVFASRLFDTVEEEFDFEKDFERVEIVTGTISRIAADVKELTIGSTTFGIADKYSVEINDKAAKFNDLRTLMEVRVVLKNEKMAEIYAYGTEEEAEIRDIVTGAISSIDKTNKKLTVGLKNFDVLENAKVEVNGDVAGFSHLATDMETVLVLLNNQVESIYAFELADEAELEFEIDRETETVDDDFKEASITGARVSDTTPDLEGEELEVRINGSSYKTIDLDEIDGRQDDGEEVAEELEEAIEDALDDDRVKVSYKSTKRFIFETYDSPINQVPSIQFDGDSDVLEALGLDDDKVSGTRGDLVDIWKITVENDATKDQTYEIEVVVDDENIDETITFSVDKGDTAEEIADAIADALIAESDIRAHFSVRIKDEEVTLVPDDNENWDVEIEIDEK